ncbi:hypothetical protein PINS_up013378 [Pythium insidiosum]|nr:hypothetical protein PINS_up013378 [Pythium insidiosum]
MATTWPVTLRVYDLSRGMARQLSPALLGKQIDGIWHTGVMVYGQEYFYGGGIQMMAPELVVARYGMQPVQQIPLGETRVPRDQFEAFLRSISPRFTAETYDLLRNNCNNFSHELSQYLLDGRGIPQHILDLPNEALSTPLGAMLRPMLENMQREMNATGTQPFAIPFNDPSRATAPVVAPTPAPIALSSKMMVSAQPTLYLDQIVRRIAVLNGQVADAPVLSDEDIASLHEMTTVLKDHPVDLGTSVDSEMSKKATGWWKILEKLLSKCATASSPLFFPTLGLFRALLLIPTNAPVVLEAKTACFDLLLRIADQHSNGVNELSTSQIIMMLSVPINGFANPVASELVLKRAVEFLPFAFKALTESSDADVRLVCGKLIRNCCLALRMEEEMVITTIICGSVEALERLSRDASSSPSATHTVEGVITGVAQLLKSFEAARSLSVELGLAEVLRRLHATPSLRDIQPLLSEVVALI